MVASVSPVMKCWGRYMVVAEALFSKEVYHGKAVMNVWN